MGEESNIQEAKPKEGLETGGLETGSLSPKDRVASAYEADLSGQNGPRARFDALEELMARQLEEFSARLSFTSGDGTQIFGGDGYFVVQSPNQKRAFGAVTESARRQGIWDLRVENFETGSVSIRVGEILKDSSDLTDTLDIQNGSASFVASNGSKLFLKITNDSTVPGEFTPKCELKMDNLPWVDYPSAYEVSGEEDTATFEAYYYPLYYFDEDSGNDGIAVHEEGVYGHRVVETSWFRIVYTIYQNGDDRALTVPILLPSHASLPA